MQTAATARIVTPSRAIWLRLLFAIALAGVLLSGPGCALVRTPVEAESRGVASSAEGSTRPTSGPRHFDHVLIIVFENQDYAAVMGQSSAPGGQYFRELAAQGALFTNFKALFHPSYPNYLAMIGGSEFPVDPLAADRQVDLPQNPACPPPPTIGDFLTWKNYAERYPADRPKAWSIASSGRYVRRHVPFLSFRKWQTSPGIVAVDPDVADNAFFRDAGDPAAFPQYAFYSPDMVHDAHDSDLQTAGRWLQAFMERFQATRVAPSTLVVVTFDESSGLEKTNHIYTVFWGSMVKAGVKVNAPYNHYNVLRTIEANFGVAPFAQGDREAKIIEGVWKD